MKNLQVMSLKNLIEQWDVNSNRLTCGLKLENAHKEIKERIRKEILSENELKISMHKKRMMGKRD